MRDVCTTIYAAPDSASGRHCVISGASTEEIDMTNTTRSTAKISASVGIGGTNTMPDVRVVQDLLNRVSSAHLSVDGTCGPQTQNAIRQYQSHLQGRPDGRIDPDGVTLRRLNEAAILQHSKSSTTGGPVNGLRLQQFGASGHAGCYSYAAAERQNGTDEMLRALYDAATSLHKSGVEFGVGDISLAQGGEMLPHKTHRTGKNADLRPVRNDGTRGPTSIGDPTYSQTSTRTLVEALLANSAVTRILFNDADIPGVRNYPGHHNHLHIEIR
jgi:hypothetical protein